MGQAHILVAMAEMDKMKFHEYDTLARPTKEYQEHNGAKDASTLYVENSYADFSTYGQRLANVRYPNASGLKIMSDEKEEAIETCEQQQR